MKKYASWIALSLFAIGCAHGKMGTVEQALDTSAVTKTTPIYVAKIDAANTVFSGDKAKDAARTTEEKTTIETTYASRIVAALQKEGFTNVQVFTGTNIPKDALLLSGDVTKFEHGSAAARAFVGMGAGSSNMFTKFKLTEPSMHKLLTSFEVVATSGGTSNMGSYMEAHLTDGAKKAAQYIAGKKD